MFDKPSKNTQKAVSETLFLESILIRSSTGRAEKRKEPEEGDESEKVGKCQKRKCKNSKRNEMKKEVENEDKR